ncbi:MAG: 16S rRNA (cytosine(1402)-N(4))-methyltransferase RsmH [Hyphomicrobiales bacterium]|jgi:16S rRNA (cytosine1402-N4)-methyltransferase
MSASAVQTPRHIPVLLAEVIDAVAPLKGALIVDGTFGAGGYTRGFLDAGAKVIAFDRDPDAIAAGQGLVADHGDALTLIEAPFSLMHEELEARGIAAVDAVVLDIGVSSMQLDEAHRGFAFRHDGPLDMRMDQNGPTAADIVNSWSEADLADLFFTYGEERRSRAIARFICEVREEWPIKTTRGLATLIEKLMPVRKRGPGPIIHPATRVFQALRIAVNDELGELVGALQASEQILKPGGRMAVVTFHSLEDRIVKRFFADAAKTSRGSRHQPDVALEPARFEPITRRPIVPSDEEMASNPRARSAKLRAARRTDAPARRQSTPDDGSARLLGLPQLKKASTSRSAKRGASHARG